MMVVPVLITSCQFFEKWKVGPESLATNHQQCLTNTRIVEGARHLSPHLGDRMAAARLLDRSVFVRELLPEDLKLEIAHISADEARRQPDFLLA